MARRACVIVVFLAATAAARAQAPAIFQDGVYNAASRMPASLAGGSLAPGSLITIRGVRLSDAISLTQVRIESNGSSRDLRVLSASPDVIEAQMPTDAATGKGQLTVLNQRGASLPYDLTIVPASFGIYGTNGKGFGPGRLWNVNQRDERTPNSWRTPAIPGQRMMLEGTGLGSVRTPQILVGAIPVTKLLSIAQSRDHWGVDQISFVLPPNTPEGCYVPVVIRLPGGPVSNVVTIAVQSNGKECVYPVGFPSRLHEKGNVGFVVFARSKVPVEGISPKEFVNFAADHGLAGFTEQQPDGDVNTPFLLIPPSGTCTAYTAHLGSGVFTSGLRVAVRNFATSWLDAGPNIRIRGPKGDRALETGQRQPGLYQSTLGGATPQMAAPRPLFLEPGHYSISIPGGVDVGAFEFMLDPPLDLSWTNAAADRTIERSRGVTVTWRARRAHQILIAAMGVDQLTTAAGFFVCLAPARAGRFFVPPEMLANIPQSQAIPGIPMDYMFVATWDGRHIAAPGSGLSQMFAGSAFVRGQTVRFR